MTAVPRAVPVPNEAVVTTTMFSEAEQAAWRVAVDRGLSITAADLRRMLEAAETRVGFVPESEIAVAVAAAMKEIRAQVYAEIRQLAAEARATYEVRRPCSCGATHCRGVLLDAHAQFADLIPGGETDGDDA